MTTDQPTQHDFEYMASVVLLTELLIATSEAVSACLPTLTAAGITLPRQSDSAATVMAWRTVLENLTAVETTAASVSESAKASFMLIVDGLRAAGRFDEVFPQPGTIN